MSKRVFFEAVSTEPMATVNEPTDGSLDLDSELQKLSRSDDGVGSAVMNRRTMIVGTAAAALLSASGLSVAQEGTKVAKVDSSKKEEKKEINGFPKEQVDKWIADQKAIYKKHGVKGCEAYKKKWMQQMQLKPGAPFTERDPETELKIVLEEDKLTTPASKGNYPKWNERGRIVKTSNDLETVMHKPVRQRIYIEENGAHYAAESGELLVSRFNPQGFSWTKKLVKADGALMSTEEAVKYIEDRLEFVEEK